MVKHVYVEASIKDYVGELKNCNTGIVIGQICDEEIYIIYIAKTPEEKELNLKQANLWIRQHVRQALNMLPGGLEVIGLYYFGKDEHDIDHIVQTLEKDILNFQLLRHPYKTKTKLLINITKNNLDITSYDINETFQILSTNCGLSYKFVSFTTSWLRVDSNIILDWHYLLKNKETLKENLNPNRILRAQLKHALLPYVKSLVPEGNGLFEYVINDQFVDLEIDGNNLLASYKTNSFDNQSNQETQTYTVDLFKRLDFDSPNIGNNLDFTHPCLAFAMNGSLAARAYVPPNATVKMALEALISDIVRSLSARFEIIVDEEDTYEHERESRTFFEAPSRVFVPLGKTGLTICDYIFRGEESSECLEPLKELLDLQVDAGQIESDVERFSDPSEISVTPLASTISLINSGTAIQEQTVKNLWNTFSSRSSYTTIMAFILPILFVVVAYFFKKWATYTNV